MTDDMAGTEPTSQIDSPYAATEQHEGTEAHPDAGGEPDGTTATAPVDGQARPIPHKSRGVSWIWGLARAVPGRWWGAMSVGALIVVWVALDIPLGNPLLLVLAIAAHGCLGIFCFQLYDELRRLATHMGDPKPGPLVWPWLKWLINIGWLSVLLVEIDRFVWRAPLDPPDQILYSVLCVLAFASFLALMWAAASPEHLTKAPAANRASIALDIVRGVAIGATVPLLVLGGLAAWRQNDQDDDPIAIPTIRGSSYDSYVALGDSYSAGEGLKPFLPSPQPGCHRSPEAYPLLLEFGHEVQRTFRACSGAVTHDVDLGIVGGHEPQIHPSPQPDVDLVTITVGGNDVVFSAVVQLCVIYTDCAEETFEPPDVKVGRTTIDLPDAANLTVWARSAMDGLSGNLERVYDNLVDTYPNARIIVVGYPYLFPSGGAPLNPLQRDCASVLRKVDEGERDTLRTLTNDLNTMLYGVSHEAGLDFVSPAAAWNGHEPCGDSGQYTYAVKPALQLLNPIDGATFHPNAQGQRQLARLISCYLNRYPARPPSFVDGLPPGSTVPDSDAPASHDDCSVLLAPTRDVEHA